MNGNYNQTLHTCKKTQYTSQIFNILSNQDSIINEQHHCLGSESLYIHRTYSEYPRKWFISKHPTFHYRVSVLLSIEISRDIYLFFHWDDSSGAMTRLYYIRYIISIQLQTDVHYLLSVVTPNVSFRCFISYFNEHIVTLYEESNLEQS